MYLHRILEVKINHDIFDITSLIITSILGVTAIYSLWLSRKAFKKSEFDSAMSTSPSIIIRPRSIWVRTKQKEEYSAYGIVDTGRVIKKESDQYEIAFEIEFECFNAGRGAAFNISQPKSTGILISNFRNEKTPLYLTTEDEPFEIAVMLKGKFENFYEKAHIEIPVNVSLFYTNDQTNIFCKSNWSAKIKIFDKEGEDLKVRDIRLLQRSGKIEYSQKPFK